MSSFDIMCKSCQSRIRLETENDKQIKYCPFCAEKVTLETKETVENHTVTDEHTPIKMKLPPRPQRNRREVQKEEPKEVPKETAAEKKSVPEKKETKTVTQCIYPKAECNAKFMDSANTHCCDGWVPNGYKTSVKVDGKSGNADFPIIVWAYAKNDSGKEMFKRIIQPYSVSKSNMTEENRFREFEEYLDTNAVALLKTDKIRLIRTFPISRAEEENLRNRLRSKREQLEKLSHGDMLQFVVQSLYAGEGGRLYEADVNGEKRYALLYTLIMGSEYGTYSPMSNQMQARNQQLLNNIMGMVNRGYGGGYFPNFQQPQQMNTNVQIDTDPNTPFGRHRADGLSTAVAEWQIISYSGFLSPTMPTEQEIEDFFRFLNTVRISDSLNARIEQVQCAIISQNMQTQQAIFNANQNMLRNQQASFERSQAAIRSLNDTRDSIMQQRIASDNARFDRSVRRNHEMIMGVNTYTRTDGVNIEVPVTADRVFQNTNDPSQIVGASAAADVPYGWTELHKLD